MSSSAAVSSTAVTVFCGSRYGSDPAYAAAARALGAEIARRGWTLVYGGAHVGLMGVAADAALAAGGRVVGIIPGVLVDLEVAHQSLTEIHIVDSMAARKHQLLQRADVVVCLAGGLGTLDELFEALTWNQLKLHPRHQRLPIGLVDTLGTWQPTKVVLEECVARGFADADHLGELVVDAEPATVLDRLGHRLRDGLPGGGSLPSST